MVRILPTLNMIWKKLKTTNTTEIRIIGPQASGKTTYLATLAYFSGERLLPGIKIEPVGEDTEKLASMAKDILCQGSKLALTEPKNGEEPFYYFRLQRPSIKGLANTEIELIIRDFGGDIFEDYFARQFNSSTARIYFEDLFRVTGWMIMLTDWQADRENTIYVPVIQKLCQELSNRARINPAMKNLRIAVVMSKCERGEIWPGRLAPGEDIFQVRLPETYKLLNKLLPPKQLKFFACSSFGVLSDRLYDFDPRPNRFLRDDGGLSEFNAFLRNPIQWQPFGLLTPIYWLSTGKMLENEKL